MEHDQTNIPEPRDFWTFELLHTAVGALVELESPNQSTKDVERLINDLSWYRNPGFVRTSTLHLSMFMTVCREAGFGFSFAVRRDFSSAAESVLSLLERVVRRETNQAQDFELAANFCRALAGAANTYLTYQGVLETYQQLVEK